MTARRVDAAYNGPMRYLGVDPGGRKLGLAVGDDQTGIVTPLEVVRCSGVTEAAATIARVLMRVGAERAIIGLPTLADGSVGPAARRSELLVEAVRALGFDAELQPEHLTTHEARSRAREIDRAQNLPVDDLAAQVILEDYLARRGGSVAGGN